MLAQRVGPSGRVTGLDVDADVGREAVASLHADGHAQCEFVEGDVLGDDVFPETRFDLVYARLLLFHLEDPVAAVRRLWEWTAPGGQLVLQDYDLSTLGSDTPLPSVEHFRDVVVRTMVAAGCDVIAGRRLPALLAEAGERVAGGLRRDNAVVHDAPDVAQHGVVVFRECGEVFDEGGSGGQGEGLS